MLPAPDDFGPHPQATLQIGSCSPVWRPGRLAMRWARALLKSCASHSATSRFAVACYNSNRGQKDRANF